ncbi:Gfo/Idh/MocA family oxidoreductase [Chitinophagaceae bacterium LB-8]|uniref:Gfo/Idh/MocA family oxidoreductase n=1 Tax=Paraflavisolibacter caeni TaxID=2982496 RepID=A0A9X2XNL0_9BACT|nr:Gfo/Idh/MocA family oxidoreductase [Paraflavisolibacter caeni]MCU7549028.1 Gfo/Idh/MocA family oxidoreductase [Paraflavisolibacter caeni]
MKRKLRMGMIGGGTGSFIGAVHRIAANTDGLIELVCGAFSTRKDVAMESGRNLFLPDERIYASYDEMIERESKLPSNERMDFVSIVTPNHAHFDPAYKALDSGFHVMIDKPITLSLEEAKLLKEKVSKSGLLLGLTHTYTGYPMVKQAKEIVASGALGNIVKIYVSYHQGWLSKFSGSKEGTQAAWRTDPKRSGKAGGMGDIGTHAFNLAEYITGLQVTELCAQLNIVVEGRLLDDDGAVLLKFNNGASGVLTATQIAAGEENELIIKVYGEKGGLVWQQQEPNTLILKWQDKPAEILRAGSGYLSSIAQHNSRTPGGHPEGYLEAFANIYRNFAITLSSRINAENIDAGNIEFPSVEEGVRGMAFIENVVRSSGSSKKWTEFEI